MWNDLCNTFISRFTEADAEREGFDLDQLNAMAQSEEFPDFHRDEDGFYWKRADT